MKREALAGDAMMLAEPISLKQIAGIIIVFFGVLITVKTDVDTHSTC